MFCTVIFFVFITTISVVGSVSSLLATGTGVAHCLFVFTFLGKKFLYLYNF